MYAAFVVFMKQLRLNFPLLNQNSLPKGFLTSIINKTYTYVAARVILYSSMAALVGLLEYYSMKLFCILPWLLWLVYYCK